ncbi:MAG: glycosyltransferase, partial [Erythrobacter sp.]
MDYVIGCVQSDVEVPQPEGSRLMVLSAPTVRAAFRPLCRYLREERPEIIFSAEDHLNAAVAIAAILTRSKVRISGSSRISPFDTYSDKPFSKGWVLKHLVRATAWRQNVMTCVSQGNLEQYRTVMPNITYHVAYNVVADAGVNALLSEPLAGDPWLPAHTRAGNATDLPVVLAAGTLETWKGFDNLIRAIGLLCEAGRPTRLIVLGEGSQRSTLENLVAELGLGDFVRLPGREANPYRFFVRASAFALSSHIESFGNVLVEAMLAGATPVATDCPTGPREVLG